MFYNFTQARTYSKSREMDIETIKKYFNNKFENINNELTKKEFDTKLKNFIKNEVEFNEVCVEFNCGVKEFIKLLIDAYPEKKIFNHYVVKHLKDTYVNKKVSEFELL